jgi:hypothetical protein
MNGRRMRCLCPPSLLFLPSAAAQLHSEGGEEGRGGGGEIGPLVHADCFRSCAQSFVSPDVALLHVIRGCLLKCPVPGLLRQHLVHCAPNTSSFKPRRSKDSISHAPITVCTESQIRLHTECDQSFRFCAVSLRYRLAAAEQHTEMTVSAI